MSAIDQDKNVVAARGLSRRHFIQGVAATGVGAGLFGLAACGGDGESTETTVNDTPITGFEVDLSSYSRDDINLLAPYLKSALAEIGITVNIKQADSYYTEPWSSQESKQVENNIWLESNFGITDFGHRGTPDVVLTRVFASTGDWNAAQYKSPEMDAAITAFKTAPTPEERTAAATTIQEICLEDTPYILLYFQTAIAIVRKGITGFYSNGMAQFESAAVTGETVSAGTLRVAIGKVANPPTPYTTNDQGSLQIIGCVGEYLAWENDKGEVEPRVAESWESTDGGTTWTYKIRQGITFHDGSPLTADDVVWSIAGHLNADNASTQKGTFDGVLVAENVTKVDDFTVQFVCDAPTGALPNLLSSTTYGLVMMKNGDKGGDGWQKTMNSCGPWILDSYTDGASATLKANPNYWDSARKPSYETLELVVFESADAAIAQLNAGELDVVSFVSASSVGAVDTAAADLVRVPSSGTLMVHMRNDFGPFQDKRVRRAAALALSRADYLSGVLNGEGSLGNDSITSAYPALNDGSVAQRELDLETARALMREVEAEAAAG